MLLLFVFTCLEEDFRLSRSSAQVLSVLSILAAKCWTRHSCRLEILGDKFDTLICWTSHSVRLEIQCHKFTST